MNLGLKIFLELLNTRKEKKVSKNKSERKKNECRINRTYQDFFNYKTANSTSYYVEMDTVEGIKGHSVLLTLNFIPFSL